MPGKVVGPGFNSADLKSLITTLNQLRGTAQPRVWPLYTGAGSVPVRVSGFAVARVVSVTPPPDANAPLLFALQPTMLAATATAVTDPSRPVRNRYVCKIRVVQ